MCVAYIMCAVQGPGGRHISGGRHMSSGRSHGWISTTTAESSFKCRCVVRLYMSDNTSSTKEWYMLWNEYTKSLENWKKMYEQAQAASSDMQSRFNEVWEKASADTSADTMKIFAENWQKAMSDAGIRSFKEFSEGWQKALSESGSGGFAQFAGNWQKALGTASLEQMNAYGEMLKRFADTWDAMWPRH